MSNEPITESGKLTPQRRKPAYISPSAYFCWKNNPEDYYKQYICPTRTPRFPQTRAMSVGSAFDARIKSFLHEAIYGVGNDPKYSQQALFESQVEEHNRDFARDAGDHCFREYQESGAIADLMLELESAADDPRFEFEVKGVVEGYREGVTKREAGVVLLGRPDIRFVNSEGAHVIFDWKVNGYCSNSPVSPKPGYTQLRSKKGGGWQRLGQHKDCLVQKYKGIYLNSGCYLESYSEDWAIQLTTYAWLLGEPVGSETIGGIDQLACNTKKLDIDGNPDIRIASHRSRVSEGFQFATLAGYQNLWGIINSDYFFRDLSYEDSQKKCELLDQQALMLMDAETDSLSRWIMNGG